eukprot:SM000035S13074  [mRNA]  locus=s35:205686:208743:- [translate_table: standard]
MAALTPESIFQYHCISCEQVAMASSWSTLALVAALKCHFLQLPQMEQVDGVVVPFRDPWSSQYWSTMLIAAILLQQLHLCSTSKRRQLPWTDRAYHQRDIAPVTASPGLASSCRMDGAEIFTGLAKLTFMPGLYIVVVTAW